MMAASTDEDPVPATSTHFCETSDFTNHLTPEEISRYDLKLRNLDITDPYKTPGLLFTSLEDAGDAKLPDLQYPDIYNYLINFPSSYTQDCLRAYKSLDGYRFFQSGFVHTPLLWSLPNKGLFVIIAKVNHLQKLNDPQLRPWVVVSDDGQVKGAHCNCMAGLGEACAHVAAVLFAVQASVSLTQGIAPIAMCRWSQPSQQSLREVEYAEARHIMFNNKIKSANGNSQPSSIPALTDEEKRNLYNSLSACKSTVCYCQEPASSNMLDCASGFCTIKRFHQSCLRLQKMPRGMWVCPGCRTILNSKQKKQTSV